MGFKKNLKTFFGIICVILCCILVIVTVQRSNAGETTPIGLIFVFGVIAFFLLKDEKSKPQKKKQQIKSNHQDQSKSQSNQSSSYTNFTENELYGSFNVPVVSFSLSDLFRAKQIKQDNLRLQKMNRIIEERFRNSGITEYGHLEELRKLIADYEEREDALDKSISSKTKKLNKISELYKSIEYSRNTFAGEHSSFQPLSDEDLEALELFAPDVAANLHCMTIKELRKAYRENEKRIRELFDQYAKHYTSKSNQTIFSLITISLQSEMQTILSNVKYGKLEDSISAVQKLISDMLSLMINNLPSIATTMTRLMGELEYLYITSVKIEYDYYVKKEQAKQEQLAIRQKMREEAEERKALEAERKKVEAEEAKFHSQISALKETAANSSGSELEALQARILELEGQLSSVIVKKDEIANLQNGKAGNVYVISNLGSFGDDVFKIGMTRRLNPQDRVDELGSASVPFRFDVHSFIFSDDASKLETELHNRLNDKRLNKVNLRKEFFRVSIDELEALVNEICPTAEFNRTMLATEFHQSENPDYEYNYDNIVDEEEEEE